MSTDDQTPRDEESVDPRHLPLVGAGGVRGRRPMKIGFLVFAALFLAACGSHDNGGGKTHATMSPSPGKLTLSTADGAHGSYLTDGSGRALYEWVADRDGKSSCMGACASAWPP